MTYDPCLYDICDGTGRILVTDLGGLTEEPCACTYVAVESPEPPPRTRWNLIDQINDSYNYPPEGTR